jgi:hypothetical protein
MTPSPELSLWEQNAPREDMVGTKARADLREPNLALTPWREHLTNVLWNIVKSCYATVVPNAMSMNLVSH